MGRPVDPSRRYISKKPCALDGTSERYRGTHHCCECRARSNGVYVSRSAQRASEKKPEIVERVIAVRDPTRGAVFPASRSQLMAGR